LFNFITQQCLDANQIREEVIGILPDLKEYNDIFQHLTCAYDKHFIETQTCDPDLLVVAEENLEKTRVAIVQFWDSLDTVRDDICLLNLHIKSLTKFLTKSREISISKEFRDILVIGTNDVNEDEDDEQFETTNNINNVGPELLDL
jgi:hypothetical protein